MIKTIALLGLSLMVAGVAAADSLPLESAYKNYCESLPKRKQRKKCVQAWDQNQTPDGISIKLRTGLRCQGEFPISITGTQVTLSDQSGSDLVQLNADAIRDHQSEYVSLNKQVDLKTLSLNVEAGHCSTYRLTFEINN